MREDHRLRAALTLSSSKGISVEAALGLGKELRLAELIHTSIWSDETEMMAKLLSVIRLAVYGKYRHWTHLLPERYLNSANITIVPKAQTKKIRDRHLSSFFDKLAAAYKKEIDERRQQN